MGTNTLRSRLEVLQSLVDFAQMPADELSSREDEIQTQMERLASSAEPFGLPWRSPALTDDSDASAGWVRTRIYRRGRMMWHVTRRARRGPLSVRKLQPLLLAMLKVMAVSARAMGSKAAIEQREQGETNHPPYFRISIEAVNEGSGLRLWARADAIRERVLYMAFLLVEQVGRDRLRTCAANDCEKLLVNSGKRSYCSSRCSQREYMRGYRENQYMKPPRRGDRKEITGGTATRKRRR